MKINNKLKLIISIIVAILVTIIIAGIVIGVTIKNDYTDSSKYITSLDKSTWEVGQYLGMMAVADPGETQGNNVYMHKWDGTVDKYVKGFQFAETNDFFCIEKGQTYASGRKKLVYKIVIDGEIATIHGDGFEITGNTTEEAKASNRILAEIIRESLTYSYNDPKRNKVVKKSDTTYDFAAYNDIYQCAIWLYIETWDANVFGGKLKELGYVKGISGDNIDEYDYKGKLEQGKQIIDNIIAKDSRGELQPAEISIQNNTKIGKELTYDNIKEVGDMSYIGPFRFGYSGTVVNYTTTFGKIYSRESDESFREINQIPNNNDFYIGILSSNLKELTSDELKITATVNGQGSILTSLYILAGNYNANLSEGTSVQTFMAVDQSSSELTRTAVMKHKLILEDEVTIQKVDEDGKNQEGVIFKINQVVDGKTTEVGKLITDESGKTEKVSLKIGKVYQLHEAQNNNYGYKKRIINKDSISITGGTIVNYGDNYVNFIITDEAVINIKNQQELMDIDLTKEGDSKTPLKDVEFALEIHTKMYDVDYYKYLQLYDSNGKFVDTITGEVTINENNIAKSNETETEYNVVYKDFSARRIPNLTEEELKQITKFKTNSSGIIKVKNLEAYSSTTTEYDYTAYELSNKNYGYKANSNAGKVVNVKPTATKVTLVNEQALGNIKVTKVDAHNQNIKLSQVGFKIEVTAQNWNSPMYIALLDKDNKKVEEIAGIATINNNNKALDNEYTLKYVSTQSEATTFITDENGQLQINNLEVYEKLNSKYIYKLIEVINANYGYVVESQEFENITVEKSVTTEKIIPNMQTLTKISGYVWVDELSGKDNKRDNVYTNDVDTKLTDLYETDENGNVTKVNENAKIPVEVYLFTKNNQVVKAKPDQFDKETGKYTFTDVQISELENYKVVFIYNGFYYTTVEPQLNIDNGSKVQEETNLRESLNNKFASVEDNAQIISTEGTINTIEYNKEGRISTVSKLNFGAEIYADTSKVNLNLSNEYYNLKNDGKNGQIENINMGIVLREQPQISINSDIYSSLIEFEGYKYNYKYNGRQNYYENINADKYDNDNDNIGVKFEQETTEPRYTRKVYASDIQAVKDLDKDIKLSITYKIQVANKSKTLTVNPKQIINYFDARYQIEAVGLGIDETNHTLTNLINYSTPQNVQSLEQYNSIVIDFNQMIDTQERVKDLYITFNVSREAIVDLLNQSSTYHNASEIISYATYYGEETFETGEIGTQKGKLYAGIDKVSQPGNMELKLIDHPSGGTQILDTSNYEDDSTSAPSLVLEAIEERKISGTVWEDAITNTANNEKLGNGIFDEGERLIKGVKVELCKVNDDGTVGDIAKYSNGSDVSTITDDKGNYTFGYYDEENKKHIGILPGKYVIKYTYNNESYIVDKENINVNDYKSTIITSEIIKNAFEVNDNQRWYLIDEGTRYSDARDDLSLRKEYDYSNSDFTVTNSTYNDILALENMDAYTPIMDIGIEFTESNEAEALTFDRVVETKNFDFGIVERPNVDITIKKEITGLEIVSQNGTSIIPYGNPSDINSRMQYVKYLDGLASVEIESDLLQGAKLSLEYTITLVNNSNTDYFEAEYYYYGTGGITEITTRAKQVVDYLDVSMSLESDRNEGIWTEQTADDLYENRLIYHKVNDKNSVYDELKTGNYRILTTNAFEEVGAESSKEVKLYASRALATSDEIREENRVEIIELIGVRTIKGSIPGNYVPTNSPNEPDEDRVDLVITPPTGTTVNYILYIISGIATFAILISGIVIIKKKLIK